MQRLHLVLALVTALVVPVGTVSAQTFPFCPPDQSPRFVLGFAALKDRLGDQMGKPLECEHANPENGDSLQQTTAGLAFYRQATNTPTFTNGHEHWALTPDGLVSWTGQSIDPPISATPSEQTSATQTPVLVELPTDWAVGDKRRVEVVHEQETYRGGQRTNAEASRSSTDVEVVSKSPVGYVFRWTWGPTEVMGDSSQQLELMTRIANLTDGLRVDVRTDEVGTPLAIENLTEVVAAYQQAIEMLLESLRGTGVADEQLELIRRALEPLLDEPAIEQATLQGPQIFTFASGATLQLGETYEYEDLLPNLLGGDSYPSRAWFRLAAVDETTDTATIELRQSIDQTRAGEILTATLTELMARMGVSAPDGAALPALRMEDSATFVMHTVTGWPQVVEHQRVIELGDVRRVERTGFSVAPTEG